MLSISKSTVKASGCELYFKSYVMDRITQFPIDITIAGTEFHDYRSKYTDHLVETGARQDPEWAFRWLEATGVSQEGRDIIERDIAFFEIDPETVYGTEQFLVVDEEFKPIRGVPFPGFGKPPAVDGAFAHGTVDLLLFPTPEQADIIDYKSGWATPTDKYEAQHYAALVFAWFEHVQVVTFTWHFPRRGKISESERFTRYEHFEWLRSRVTTEASRVNNLRESLESGARPAADPFSDLCPFCTIECPVRRMAIDHVFPSPPLQTDEDARHAARYVAAARSQLGRVEGMLRAYVSERGPVQVSAKKLAGMVVKETKRLPLRPVLEKLGIEIPEEGPFEMPMGKLYISASSWDGYARAKKRAGLSEMIEGAVKMEPRQELRIYEEPDGE